MADHAGRGNEQAGRKEHLFVALQFGINLLMTIGMTMLMAVLMFRGRATVPLWGAGNLAFDLVPSTVMPCIGATFAITRAIKAAATRGLIRPITGKSLENLPGHDVLAGLVLGLGLLVVLGPPLIGAEVWLYGPRPLGFSDIVAYKLIYAVILTCVNTPLIIVRAWSGRGAHEQQAG